MDITMINETNINNKSMKSLQMELIELTCPNQRGVNRIMSLSETGLKYEIAQKKRVLANWEYEGCVLAGRVNIIDA